MKQRLKIINLREHFAFTLFFITATLLIVVTAVISVYIKQMEEGVVKSVENHLIAAAMAASTYLTVEELDLFHTIEDIERPEWAAIREKLHKFAQDYRVLYVYYWRQVDEQIQYIIDNDDDEESMATPDLFFDLDEEEDPETSRAVPHIMGGGNWITDLGTYTGTWDGVISGVVPVFNEDGSVYCAAGVDLSDAIILNQRRHIRLTWRVLIGSIFLSLISGFFGMWMYLNKSIQSDNANKYKSTFLSAMSHEIRTPMNAVIGIAQIELQKKNLPTEYAEAFEKIYTSGDVLLKTINNILDLSKIETGKLELFPVEYSLPSLIHDAVQINIVRIGSKPIKLLLDVDEFLPEKLIGDELRLKQILNNLLSNAIKYTEKGQVKLTVFHSISENEHDKATKPDETVKLHFVVEDTGQGMKQSDISKLFSEYTRFNTAKNKATEGTGIGLTITKSLVDAMDGKIDVKTELGKGTKFSVAVTQKPVECEPIGFELADQLNKFTYSETKKSKNFSFEHEQMPYGRVLIVDDVETNLYVAEGLMIAYDLQIDLAVSGMEVIERIKSGNIYDIIFMDQMMPIMDGIATTQTLRSMGYKGVIVALTANALAGNDELFKSKGFDDFLSKPMDIKLLDKVLLKYIKDKHNYLPPDDPQAKVENETQSPPIIYTKLLEVFQRDAKKAVLNLQNSIENNDLKSIITTTHAMKSALKFIGEPEMSEMAYQLEQAALKGNNDFIEANCDIFATTLKTLLKRVELLLARDFDDAAICEDENYLKEQLLAIKEACINYDDTTVFAILKSLNEKQWKNHTKAELQKIHDTLFFTSDFEKIIESVEEMRG